MELNAAGLQLFEAFPGNRLLLLPDPPRFTVTAATADYYKRLKANKQALIGRGIVEVSFDHFLSADQLTNANLLASLEQVVATNQSSEITVRRNRTMTDANDVAAQDCTIFNKPVFDENGKLTYIIHSFEDVAEATIPGSIGIQKAYNLFMSAPVIIGILKGDDYIVELANKCLLEVWGRTSDVIGKPLLEAVPELRDQGFIPLLNEVRKTGEPFYAYEFPITLQRYGKDEVLYFDFVYMPIYEEGTANGIISVGHDVTTQVTARQRVQESEAKYRSLFESMDQGFCILEMIFDEQNNPVDYRFLETNPVFEKQTGLKDAVGKTALELVPNLESTWLEIYGQVALTGETTRFIEGSKAMGRWFEVYAYRMGDENSRKVALLFTDITQRKNSEEALRQSERNLRNTILQAPFAISFLKGPQFIVEIANDRMYELWGRGKKEVLGKSIFEGMPEVKNQGYEELLTGVFSSGRTFSAHGIPVTLPRNGTVKTVYIDLLYEAFREADGSVSGVVAVAIDVTQQILAKQQIEAVVAERTQELARANQALLHSNQELARSNQNLEEFAYAASHDLKEPLRKIQIFSDRLKHRLSDNLPDEANTYFNRIQHATHRMKTLVDDLLMYSHVSIGTEKDEMINLNEKVKHVLEDLELEIEEKKASISVEALPTIRGHRRQLQQVFQNLISNAIKYTRPGLQPQVNITCRVVNTDELAVPITMDKENKPYYLVEVKDNGIGFNPGDAERIFTVFTRLHHIEEHTGTGLGLSIARKVVENHGGYIWAESQPGQGAVFKILFPVA